MYIYIYIYVYIYIYINTYIYTYNVPYKIYVIHGENRVRLVENWPGAVVHQAPGGRCRGGPEGDHLGAPVSGKDPGDT